MLALNVLRRRTLGGRWSAHLLSSKFRSRLKYMASTTSTPPASSTPSNLFKPVKLESNPEHNQLGAEIANFQIQRPELLMLLNRFYASETIVDLAKDHGLDDYLYKQAFVSFRKYCLEINHVHPDLYVKLSDVLQAAGDAHVDDLFPYFLTHARQVFSSFHVSLLSLRHIGCLGFMLFRFPGVPAFRLYRGPQNKSAT